jgi:hypothetical protein
MKSFSSPDSNVGKPHLVCNGGKAEKIKLGIEAYSGTPMSWPLRND